MTPAYLHKELMKACKSGNVADVKHWLNSGAEPNLNIRRPTNALDTAIEVDNHQIINLLLERGAIIKEFVIQKAVEKDKSYLDLLIPNFNTCNDQDLLMGVLLAAMNINDVSLAKQAIHQGAKPESLFIYSIFYLNNREILQLLLQNGFNIHAEKNIIFIAWMGSSTVGRGKKVPEKPELLALLSSYYLDKPRSIEKFNSLGRTEKLRLFRMGLDHNNFDMMKFAYMIGADKNEALNSALYRYYAHKQEGSANSNAAMFKNHRRGEVGYDIIEYILNSNIEFKNITISNAVCFNYTVLLNALSRTHDLAYGYEMAFKYEKDALLNYFVEQGVSKEAQHFAKMRVSAIKGNIKALRKAVNDGANVKNLNTDVIIELIYENQVESLKYLHDSGVVFNTSLNQYLNKAMSYHKAYESVSYLIELGLDITSVKNIPAEYKKKYPIIADMWEKRFMDIFDYTIYLVKEVHPRVEGKEKEKVLKRIAELSTLPYVLKMSKEKSPKS